MKVIKLVEIWDRTKADIYMKKIINNAKI